MASTPSNGLKRPHPEDLLDAQVESAKRSRSNNGSPAPQPATNGATAPGKPDVATIMAEARARAAAAAARLGGGLQKPASPSPGPLQQAPSTGASRLEQLKARVAAATKGAGTAATAAQSRSTPPKPTYQQPQYEDDSMRARGGLDVGLHPALMADSKPDTKSGKGRGVIQSKFSTTMGNRRSETPGAKEAKKQLDLAGPSLDEIKSNPYFDASLGDKTATSRGRISKHLVFNQKGKYIQQAAALRRQQALEAMKKRIAESSRRAGIDEDLDTEKAFLVEAPPVIEWWDEALVNGADYSDIESPSGLKLEEDSIITAYIQHPVPLEPPQDKLMPAPKPMFLTPKEQRKQRRQRRMAEQKEQQDKIRLGLEPAPPPKVKRGNLMRVLGEEAVKDPTAVEARVNREIQEREDAHYRANEERKLTKEQRHEKLEEQQAGDAARGVFVSVYRIESLSNGRHRFKIAKNAEQNALTGVCILHPRFSLVVVEGGAHSIAHYRKLMTQRIDWRENSMPNAVREGNREITQAWLREEDEKGNLKDLGLNECSLVWEGQVKQRMFRKWGSRVCETDAAAREVLGRAKMGEFWTTAKSWKTSSAEN